MNAEDNERAKPVDSNGAERGEHSTDTKQRIQEKEPRDERVRERGPDTDGGNLRPGDR